MNYDIEHGNEVETSAERWERLHDFKVRWVCPTCDYAYEARPNENERLKCPTCGEQTVEGGHTYEC